MHDHTAGSQSCQVCSIGLLSTSYVSAFRDGHSSAPYSGPYYESAPTPRRWWLGGAYRWLENKSRRRSIIASLDASFREKSSHPPRPLDVTFGGSVFRLMI